MRVLIIGSGYAGVWCYRSLRKKLGSKVQIVMVSENPFHIFHGFVGDVLGGDMPPTHLNTKLSECAPKAEHVTGRIIRVLPSENIAVALTQAGEQELHYDHLVVATGAKEATSNIPGLQDHGLMLRRPGVVSELNEQLQTAHAIASIEAPLKVAVIGAGFTGTEIAAALGRRLGPLGRVHLIASSDKPVPTWGEQALLQRHLSHSLERAGVNFHPETRVVRVDEESVLLHDGRTIPADIVVAAAGLVANLPDGLQFYTSSNGYLRASRELRVASNIWAAGDVVHVLNRYSKPAIKDALWATAAGSAVGSNIALVARGREPRPFTFRGLGAAATFRPGFSVARLLGMPLTGAVAYWLRQGFFHWFVPSRRNAIRLLLSRLQHPKNLIA